MTIAFEPSLDALSLRSDVTSSIKNVSLCNVIFKPGRRCSLLVGVMQTGAWGGGEGWGAGGEVVRVVEEAEGVRLHLERLLLPEILRALQVSTHVSYPGVDAGQL